MKKRFLLASLILPVFLLSCNSGSVPSFADMQIPNTCAPVFSPKYVSAILNHQETIKFLDYTPEDFPNVKCSEIETLFKCVTDEQKEWAIKNGNYRYILYFYLIDRTISGAFNAAKELDKDLRVYSTDVISNIYICWGDVH